MRYCLYVQVLSIGVAHHLQQQVISAACALKVLIQNVAPASTAMPIFPIALPLVVARLPHLHQDQ
jgi:hypothetical protein